MVIALKKIETCLTAQNSKHGLFFVWVGTDEGLHLFTNIQTVQNIMCQTESWLYLPCTWLVSSGYLSAIQYIGILDMTPDVVIGLVR